MKLNDFALLGCAGIGFSTDDVICVADLYLNPVTEETAKKYICSAAEGKSHRIAIYTHWHYDHGLRPREMKHLLGEGFTLYVPEGLAQRHKARKRFIRRSRELTEIIDDYKQEGRIIWVSDGTRITASGTEITAFQSEHGKINPFNYLRRSELFPSGFYEKLKASKEHLLHPGGNTLGYSIKEGDKKYVILGSCGICEDKAPKDIDTLFMPLLHEPPYEYERGIIATISPRRVVPTHNDGADPLIPEVDPAYFAKAVSPTEVIIKHPLHMQ